MEDNREIDALGEIEALRTSGKSVMDIAKELDIPVDIVANKLHEQGSIKVSNKYLDNDANKLKVIDMKSEGMKYQDIADIVGLSKSAVSRFLRKATHKDWWATQDAVKPVLTEGPTRSEVKSQSTTSKRPSSPPSPKATETLNSDLVKETVAALNDEGKTYNEISDVTGVTYHNVRNFLLGNTYKTWWDKRVVAESKVEDIIDELLEEVESEVEDVIEATRHTDLNGMARGSAKIVIGLALGALAITAAIILV